LPISEKEFFEFKDETWKDKVFEFLKESRVTPTPAFKAHEIAQAIAPANQATADTDRKTEWALETLVVEGKVLKTRIKLNEYSYYMME
jgi:hypothetical protein